jgi:hypothetical protein
VREIESGLNMPPRSHVVITGTGRAGTTFLIELFTHLGFDTGFDTDEIVVGKNKTARAGLEHDIRDSNCPFVVKSPWFCDYAEEVIHSEGIDLRHVLVPIRDLIAAAESRRQVSRARIAKLSVFKRLKQSIRPKTFAGGLWHTNSDKPGKQEDVLLMQIYRLMLTLSNTTVPITFMQYPRIVKDCHYLYEKLQPVLMNVSYEFFQETFNRVADPELVTQFELENKARVNSKWSVLPKHTEKILPDVDQESMNDTTCLDAVDREDLAAPEDRTM